MAVADLLRDVGEGLATGAKAVGRASVPILQRTAEVVSGEAPQIDEDDRRHAEKLEDEQINAKAQILENQLATAQRYGTLTTEQQQQYADAISNLYNKPRHSQVLMEKLRKAIHPNGAYAAGPQAPLPDPAPGGTLALDEQSKLTSLEKTDALKLQEAQKEIDFWTSKLKAAGVPDEQVNAARNEAIERSMGAIGGTALPKNAKLDIQGGVLVGGTDEHGRTFTTAQIQSGEAGPTLKAMFDDFQKGERDKEDRADKKTKAADDEREKLARMSEGAVASRQATSEEFMEGMADYRSALSEYKALDTQATQSGDTVNSLKAQYAQPGNHAVPDNELQNFYTTVVQKGGKKTAAELQLTRQIGSMGMNIETMAQKAATGELPNDLRVALLKGMDAVAKEQRMTADAKKPEPPPVTGAKRVGKVLSGGTGAAQVGGKQRFSAGGKTYEIPSDKVAAFKRAHPDATTIQ
jgi:hypothetical protein